MAVTWIGNTLNSMLKTKYDIALSKTDELKNILISRNMNTEILDGMYSSLDTLTSSSLKMADSAADKMLDITNCFAAVDPDTKNGVLETMKNTINKILNGDTLNSYIENTQKIIDNANNMTDSEINDAINQVQNTTNAATNAINKAANANSELNKATQDFSQTMGKAAAFINCVNNAILEDTQLGDNIEKLVPSMNGVISTIRKNKIEGKDKSTILKESNMVIASNLKLEDKFSDVKNKITSIV